LLHHDPRVLDALPPAPARAAGRRARGRAMQRLNLTLGGGVVAVFVAAAVLSLAWTPYPVETLDIARRLQGPSAAH
jgi:peptide/nickel transport system permease protein